MRRAILASSILAAVTALAVAIPAGAVTKAHFSVVAVGTSQHRIHHGFVFRERLRRHHHVVGHDKVRCHLRRHRKASCRAVFSFRAGKIKARGNFGHGDRRVQVTGGTRAYDGVAGKILLHGSGGAKTRLEFFLIK